MTGEPSAATVAHTERVTLPDGMLRSTCSVCLLGSTQPDKGLGRAVLAAWESRHGANCPKHAKASDPATDVDQMFDGPEWFG